MENQQILAEIEKLNKGLSNPNVPESAKALVRAKIEKLQQQLDAQTKKVEQQEKKIEEEGKKDANEIQQTIDKLKKGLSNPSIPASAKETLQKKIDKHQAELDELKKEIKEDKEEVKEEKQDLEKAKKALKKAEQKAKTPGKKRGPKPKGQKQAPVPEPPKVPEIPAKSKKYEKREEKQKERSPRLKKIMSDLEELISKQKFLKQKYLGAKGKIKVDSVERDAARSSKPFGYRFKGKHDYRVPTQEQIEKGKKSGKVYYEGRPNRADKFPSGYRRQDHAKLEKGGSIDSERFAKPKGWRWKDSAVEDGIIKKYKLSKEPSAMMREKYPDYVYHETRKNKSDKKPSRRYKSV